MHSTTTTLSYAVMPFQLIFIVVMADDIQFLQEVTQCVITGYPLAHAQQYENPGFFTTRNQA